MSTEFIALLPPPGDTLTPYNRNLPHTTQDASIPSIFTEAMSIREAVFVHEQSFPLAHEFDDHDPRSFHWVVYASVSSTAYTDAGGRRSSEGSRVPVGTVRLVPPPHEAPHPGMDSSKTGPSGAGYRAGGEGGEGEGNAVRGHADEDEDVHAKARTQPLHDGSESYIKLTRLAVLAPYRRLGLASLLIDSALGWAGAHAGQIAPAADPTAREAHKMATGEAERDERWKGLVLVHAQVGVERMWAGHGFVRDEGMGVWVEDGVEHVGMWRRVPVGKV